MVHNNETKENHSKAHIHDLDMDCLMLIFEELEIVELLAIAEASPVLSYAAAEIYRRNFSKKSVRFVTPYNEASDIRISDQIINIRNLVTAVRIVKHFGHLISHLEITQYGRNCRGGDKLMINNLINYYCSESLTQLTLDINEADFFDCMNKPFINIKDLSIEGDFKSLNSKSFQFNELFPAIKSLNLRSPSILDTSCIDRKFHHLQKLSVSRVNHKYSKHLAEDDIKKLILKNPQIQNLTLEYESRSYLRFISENLLQLETLKLAFYDELKSNDKEEIRFENVKYFEMENCFDISAPKNVTMNKLEEFKTGTYSTSGYAWMDLIEKSANLKKLHIDGCALDNQEFETFARIPTNAVEIFAKLAPGVSYSSIIILAKNNQELRKIHLKKTHLGFHIINMTQLRQELADNWDISESNSHIELTRKQNVQTL